MKQITLEDILYHNDIKDAILDDPEYRINQLFNNQVIIKNEEKNQNKTKRNIVLLSGNWIRTIENHVYRINTVETRKKKIHQKQLKDRYGNPYLKQFYEEYTIAKCFYWRDGVRLCDIVAPERIKDTAKTLYNILAYDDLIIAKNKWGYVVQKIDKNKHNAVNKIVARSNKGQIILIEENEIIKIDNQFADRKLDTIENGDLILSKSGVWCKVIFKRKNSVICTSGNASPFTLLESDILSVKKDNPYV